MTTEQHDNSYGERTILRVIVLIGSLVGIGVFIIPHVDHAARISAVGFVLIVIWVLVLVVGGIWASRIRRHYCCPKCGERLPMLAPEADTNYQHRFHCLACDVIWTTDIYRED